MSRVKIEQERRRAKEETEKVLNLELFASFNSFECQSYREIQSEMETQAGEREKRELSVLISSVAR
jgi:hypothetical protein